MTTTRENLTPSLKCDGFTPHSIKRGRTGVISVIIGDDRLKLMVVCCLDNVSILKFEGRANYLAEYSPRDLVHFVAEDFLPMNELCEQASMTNREIYDRSKAVFEYFGFPYNSPPPG